MGFSAELARAKQAAVYFDNYIKYLSTLDDRQPNIGQGKDKPPQTELYIKPFGLTLTPTQYLARNATTARWDTYKEHVGDRAKDTKSGTDNVLPIKSFSPARVVIKIGLGSKKVQTAATTKRKYVTRGGVSGSIPFGLDGTENEVDAYNAIKTAILSGTADQSTIRVSRVKEKV